MAPAKVATRSASVPFLNRLNSVSPVNSGSSAPVKLRRSASSAFLRSWLPRKYRFASSPLLPSTEIDATSSRGAADGERGVHEGHGPQAGGVGGRSERGVVFLVLADHAERQLGDLTHGRLELPAVDPAAVEGERPDRARAVRHALLQGLPDRQVTGGERVQVDGRTVGQVRLGGGHATERVLPPPALPLVHHLQRHVTGHRDLPRVPLLALEHPLPRDDGIRLDPLPVALERLPGPQREEPVAGDRGAVGGLLGGAELRRHP